jgi:hypothetical protein
VNIKKLFLFALLRAPADDTGGDLGGGAPGGEAPAADSTPTASIEDTARNTYRALMEAGGDDDADGAGDPAEQTHHSNKQPRDKGKFSKAAAAAVEGEQPAANQGQQQETTEQPAQPKAHDAYPNTWRKELQADWSNLPENVRQQIHQREQDFHNGIRQYKDAAGFGSSIAQEMMPYQQVMRERGVTPQGVVRDIMGALNTMVTGSEETKAQVFLKMAGDYGINLDTVMSLRQRAPSQAAPELHPVLQRVQQLETRISQADQEREQAQQREDDARVNAFLNDPKNEHARTVAKQMSSLLMSGQAKDLQDAYEQAMWLHPEVRTKLLEKQEADRRKKEAEQAANARKAASTNVSRRGTPPAPAKAGKIEDTARDVYRRLMN